MMLWYCILILLTALNFSVSGSTYINKFCPLCTNILQKYFLTNNFISVYYFNLHMFTIFQKTNKFNSMNLYAMAQDANMVFDRFSTKYMVQNNK